MKYFLIVSFLAILITGISGFVVKPDDLEGGNFLIGIAVAAFFFLWMPIFIYHRWKNRSVKDYMLTKENIDKMRGYSKDKNL
ncbi:hypothetical protein [Aureitalea marina]|uniref:Uncharacterized protein n=1 Tax=Aureitalea marina TaxID=930804 RepID=A0A2S7KRG1_9FLAO|nr:hypothetical protein [Aureitalea marina]PQB05215.1 hypothetical protein BST85_10215 [Aureitalea marina]